MRARQKSLCADVFFVGFGVCCASNIDAGLLVAPGFVAGQIIFLIAFTLYLAAAIFALVLDYNAFAVSASSFLA